MRILVLWGESISKPGSGTVHLSGLVDGWRAAGHSVTVIAPHYGPGEFSVTDPDTHLVRMPSRNFLWFFMLQMLFILKLPLWLWKHRPNVVYTRACFFQGVLAVFCRIAGMPLVGEIDSMVDEEIRMRGGSSVAVLLARILDTLNFTLSSGLVCVTRGLRAESIRRGARPRTTAAIPNGAAVEIMTPGDLAAARKRLKLPPDAFIIGFAGAFAEWQGLDRLVEVASELKNRKRKNIRFTLMGGGPLETWIRQETASRGLSDVFDFFPIAGREQVAEFFQACDAVAITIHDMRKLRYGLSALKFWDAVSVGLPVLVPHIADLQDVLDDLGIPGTFDSSDIRDLADKIEKLADDAAVYRAGRQRVHQLVKDKYSWNAVALQVSDFFGTLTAKKGHAHA